VERDGVLFAVIEKPGRATADVLAEAIPAIVRAFPGQKVQRWGAASISTESLRWVRPLSASSHCWRATWSPKSAALPRAYATKGHRFHSEGEIKSAGRTTTDKLRACHVIVDHERSART
jgi:glycyl-tRNA synthetase beta chain